MNQSTLVYVKLGVVALFVVGVFVLAAMGKITPDAAVAAVTGGVGTLVVALGISGGASALGKALGAKTPAP
jgi:hypothetical protein